MNFKSLIVVVYTVCLFAAYNGRNHESSIVFYKNKSITNNFATLSEPVPSLGKGGGDTNDLCYHTV